MKKTPKKAKSISKLKAKVKKPKEEEPTEKKEIKKMEEPKDATNKEVNARELFQECKECGNKEMTSEYNPKTGEYYDSCDICSYYKIVTLTNKPEVDDTPKDWKPNYDTKEGKTGFLIKLFIKGESGCKIATIEKEAVKEVMGKLKDDDNISRFAITFKDPSGCYQTQLFNKDRYRVTELIEVPNNNPDKYIIYHEINADNPIDALKKITMAQTGDGEEEKEIVEWIKNLKGTVEDVKTSLIDWGAFFTKVEKVKK